MADSKTKQSKNKNSRTQESHMTWSKFGLHLIAMILLTALLLMLTVWGIQLYTHHGREVTVPDVKGIPTGSEIEKLKGLGLKGEVDDSVFLPSIPAGVIYDQSIVAGNPVKEGRVIYLTINSGSAPKLIMPDIADNSSQREATAKLRALGFKLGPVEYIHGERDWVYEVKARGRNVAYGDHIASDIPIVLVVGNGTYAEDDIDLVEVAPPDTVDWMSDEELATPKQEPTE